MITIYQRNSYNRQFEYMRDISNNGIFTNVDISGYKYKFIVKEKLDNQVGDSSAKINISGTIIDGTLGIINLILLPHDTDIPEGEYDCQLQVSTGISQTDTLFSDIFVVLKNIIRE